MNLIVDVRVHDLGRAVAFYRDTLGLPCRIISDEWAAIVVGDAELHLYLHGGVSGHVEFYVDDIEEKATELASKGVEFMSGMGKPGAISIDERSITTFHWGRTAFFKDSEGNELAIVKDNS
jgi:predicted enzyme related to lactoylglutathione lyase